MTRVLLAAVVALCAAACAPAHPRTPPGPSRAATVAPSAVQTPSGAPALKQVHDPGHVTGTIQGPCHTRDGGQLPDRSCTPGAVDPAMTAAVLCAPGYTTDSYRPPSSETTAFKYRVAYPAYGIPGNARPSELDHKVPLALGGSNDASNLWPQMGPVPNAKDHVEVQLAAWVCDGGPGVAQGRLEAAQQAVAGDWTTAGRVLGIGG